MDVRVEPRSHAALAQAGVHRLGEGARRRACVVDRGDPSPAWRADGTLAGAQAATRSTPPSNFAWNRLSSLDDALAIARSHGWRVVGRSGLTPRWETYERELKALFAKHGYRWRIRRMQA